MPASRSTRHGGLALATQSPDFHQIALGKAINEGTNVFDTAFSVKIKAETAVHIRHNSLPDQTASYPSADSADLFEMSHFVNEDPAEDCFGLSDVSPPNSAISPLPLLDFDSSNFEDPSGDYIENGWMTTSVNGWGDGDDKDLIMTLSPVLVLEDGTTTSWNIPGQPDSLDLKYVQDAVLTDSPSMLPEDSPSLIQTAQHNTASSTNKPRNSKRSHSTISPSITTSTVPIPASNTSNEPSQAQRQTLPKSRPVRKRTRKQKSAEEEATQRASFLNRNRLAAGKCRQSKKVWVDSLLSQVETLQRNQAALVAELQPLLAEAMELRKSLVDGAAAGCGSCMPGFRPVGEVMEVDVLMAREEYEVEMKTDITAMEE